MKREKWETETNRGLISAFVLAAILLVTGGYFYLKSEITIWNNQADKQLKDNAISKSAQIEAWRQERLADVREIAQSPFLQDAVNKWIKYQDKNSELKNEIQQRLQVVIRNNSRYVNVLLTDTTGQIILSGKPDETEFAGYSTGELIGTVIKTNKENIGDLFKMPKGSAVFMDIASPIPDNELDIQAVILFRVDASRQLNDLLQSGDTTSSQEAFLFRKSGDSLQYLSKLRSLPNAALSLKIPLTNTQNPAVRALKNGADFYEGIGYHDQKVLEYIQPIKDSPWFLASKIDWDELYQPVYRRIEFISIILILLFLSFSAVVFWIINYRRKHFFRQLLEDERQQAALKSHYEYVVKYANDIILLEDGQLKIVEANESAQKAYQYSLEELKKMKKTDLVAPEYRQEAEKRLKNLDENEGFVIESVHQRKDGSLFNVEISARMIKVDGQDFLHQVIRDITERKLAEMALIESEERFRATLYSTGDAIITTDIDGKVRYTNPVAEELTGWTEAEATGKPIHEIFCIFNEDTREEVENPVDKVLEKGMIVMLSNHIFLKSKNGNEIPIGDSGAPIRNALGKITGVVLVFRDQTQEREAQRKIRESEEKFRKAFRTSPDAININRLDGLYVEINEGFANLTGFTREEAIGKLSSEINIWAIPEDREKLVAGLSENGFVHNLESRFICKNGSLKTALMSANLITLNNEPHILSITRDITERKQAEAEKFRLLNIIENSLNEIYVFDTVSLKFESANQGALKNLGFSLEEFQQLTPVDIKPEFTDETFRKTIEPLISGTKDKLIIETKHQRKDGSTYPVETHLQLNKSVDKNVFLAIANDITQRLESIKALNESHERWENLFNNSPTAIAVYQVVDDGNDFVFTDFNLQAQKTDNLSRDEVIGKRISELFPGADQAGFLDVFRKVWQTGHTEHHDATLYKDNRVEGWRENTIYKLKTGEIVAIYNDVSERMKAETALRASEEQFRSIYENSVVGVYRTTPGGKIILCNRKLLQMLGYGSFEELSDRNLDSEGYEHDYPRTPFKMSIEHNGFVEDMESSWLRKDGTTIYVTEFARLVRDENNSPTFYDGIVLDITERKKMFDELSVAKEKAEESDRLKSAFLAVMSHELRTPLNAVIGFSSLIDEEMPMEQITSFAQMINKSGNNLLEIVEGIFDLTMLESGEAKPIPEIFELGNFMRHLFELLKEEQRKTGNWQVEFEQGNHIDDEALSIYADKQKITKVFVNLFRNALKFTHSGKIEFGYEFDPERKTNRITFFVKDTGIGIPENQKVLIFEKFRQAEDSYTRKYGGTGIGLAICGKTVELLGGHIGIDSEPGRGSTFYFTIPFVELQPQPPPNHGNDENEKKRFSSQTILIAEDDNSNFKYLDHLIKQAKLQVVRARDGHEAVDLCLAHPEIRLVLMDINMPKMNGFEATKKIKTSKPEIPVIAVTAFAMDGDRQKSLAEGCDEYLEKPIKREKLFTLLQRFIQ